MPGAPTWTKAENLAIYLYLELFPNKSPKEIAEMLLKTSYLNPSHNENSVYLHVLELKKLENELVVPDPVHDFRISE
jgi:iron only hydrogenase large subunit-like protein